MKRKSITSNYIYNLAYQLILILIPLFTTPYLTRVLGAKNLGIYSYTYSIVTIFFILSTLGIHTYGQREIAYVQDDRKKVSKLFWELFCIKILSTIFAAILLLIFIYITSDYSIYYKIFLIYVIANLFDITWLYQGIEDFKNVTIRNIIVKFLYLISIFIFIRKNTDLRIYILLFSLSTLFTNISFWINLNKIVNKIEIKSLNLKKHFKLIISFFIPQIAALIYTVLDKTMIGIIVPNISNVSFYEQASYIDKTILTLITTMGTVMISRVSYSFEKKDYSLIKEYMIKVINFVWLFGCALSFGVCAIIRNVVPWFYGSEYIPVIPLVYTMSSLIIIVGLNNIIGVQFLASTKQQNKYIISVLSGAFFNFILNLILIPKMGAVGAAIASVIAELFILLLELYFVRNFITIFDILKLSVKYIIFGIIMFIITYLSGNILGATIYSTILQIIVGIFTYLILLILSKDEFSYKHIFSKLKRRD